MRFNKRDGSIRWHAQFDKMSRINSVYFNQTRSRDLFICGDYQPNELTDGEISDSQVNYQAVISSLGDDGDVNWIITASGRHPMYDGGVNYNDQDRCMAIQYHDQREQLIVVIQGKMSEVRSSGSGDFYDTILVRMSRGGDIEKVTSISQGSLKYDMYTARNGVLFLDPETVYFSGWSYGFETRLQTLSKDVNNRDYDAYVYKYRFDSSNDCLILNEVVEPRSFQRNIELIYGSNVSNEGLYTFTTSYRAIPMTREDNYFIPYTSRYSGGFDLLDTMKIPRACAFVS